MFQRKGILEGNSSLSQGSCVRSQSVESVQTPLEDVETGKRSETLRRLGRFRVFFSHFVKLKGNED